ncbi:MAG: type II toxin-antitoxin system VapC family toxin [Candidatus Paceibacteria bacterium]
MRLVLDTSILVDLERGNKETINKLSELRRIYPDPPKISFISYFEFLYGLRNKTFRNRKEPLEFVEKFDVIHTSKNTADILVELKKKYEFPLADMMIASHTKEIKGVLVTKDRDFENMEEIEKIVL